MALLRITVVSQTPETVILQLEGWIADEAVALLAAEGDRRLQDTRRRVLELSEVKFIDAAGLALLRKWCQAGVVLRGGSLFLRTLLADHGLATEDPLPP